MTQPMQSAKIREGVYHVLGTSTECIIERCQNGRWALDSNGEFVESFDTKKLALIYCQEHPEL
jgi:hypothetical protein